MAKKTEFAAETNAFSNLGEVLGSAAEKLEEGTADARESAAQAVKVTRNFLVDGIYKSAYWTSYGVVFSGTYLIELFPETSSFRRGLQEGASDAETKVHEGKRDFPKTTPSKTRSVKKRRPSKKADA